MDARDLDRRALASTGEVVERTEDRDLDRPTPCDDWDVRALLGHVIGGNHLFAAAAETASDPDRRSLDHADGDHRRAYRESVDVVTAAFGRAGALEADFRLPFGVVPGATAMAIHFIDVLVHGWDLAVALGREPRLDPQLCAAALQIAGSYPEETWGDPQFFERRIVLPDDAPVQDRLVALLGREPSWAATRATRS